MNLRLKRFPIPFADHLFVTATFALAYCLLNQVLLDHWNLMSGLRLACVLLVPRKYWPALILGEVLTGLEKPLAHAQAFGIPWAMLASIPLLPMYMALCALVTRRMPLRDADGNLRITTVLVLNLILSVVIDGWTDLVSFAGYVTYPDPVQAWWDSIITYTPSFLLSNYLGTLTVVPIALVVYEYLRHRRRTAHWWPLLHEAFLLVVPYLAIVVATARTDTFASCAFVQLAIMLPLVSLTMHHGKRGAALGALLSSIAMTCTFTTELDPTTILAESLLAVVITAALYSTRPFRTIRTFDGYPSFQGRLDRISFFAERVLARIPRPGVARRSGTAD